MNIQLVCKSCEKTYKAFKSGLKGANGAFILKDNKGRDLLKSKCHPCRKRQTMENPGKKKSCRKYEKTPNGFLMRMYRNMKSRITGIQKQKAHLYLGKSLLTKDEFYTWARGHVDFKKLFKKYEESKYDRKLSPTVDRIDSSKGYELNNMEWVTHSENSRRGNISRFNRKGARQE